MKTASWIILVVVGTLTLLGSLFSLAIAYGSVVEDKIGPATLTELAAGRPEVATAVRARRATAAAYGAGFATLAWKTLLARILVVSVLILLRVPFLDINLRTPGAVTGAGTALSTLVQLGVVGLGLALGSARLKGNSSPI